MMPLASRQKTCDWRKDGKLRQRGMAADSTAPEFQTAQEEGSYLAGTLMTADCVPEELHGASVLLVLRL